MRSTHVSKQTINERGKHEVNGVNTFSSFASLVGRFCIFKTYVHVRICLLNMPALQDLHGFGLEIQSALDYVNVRCECSKHYPKSLPEGS